MSVIARLIPYLQVQSVLWGSNPYSSCPSPLPLPSSTPVSSFVVRSCMGQVSHRSHTPAFACG